MTETHTRATLALTVLFLSLIAMTGAVHAETPTMPVEELEKGMTGYGLTVFEGTEAERFPVEIMGILKNVMPDQDIILIKADTDLLNHTMIMSGMSGSPIYINDKLIGALAYSWSFEKEPLAGVTPVKNMRNASRRDLLSPGEENLKKIATPMVASGFRTPIKDEIGRALGERGTPTRFITGGQGSGGRDTAEASLSAGSAVGVQLMRGDLSLTAIGTVTEVTHEKVYAFGHPFMGAGKIEFPMTTARVLTYMPSYQSSFKLASPLETVGTITEDRQAAVVGQKGVQPSMLPVTINLSAPNQPYEESFRVELIRDRFLTPGLLNSALANFATTRLEQQGINWLDARGRVTLEDGETFEFTRTRLVSGSYSPWTLLPLARLWSNRFRDFDPQQIEFDLTLHHGRESARIEDIWVNATELGDEGTRLDVYTQINPFRGDAEVRETSITIPENVRSHKLKVTAVPSTELKNLQPSPESFRQLVDSLSVKRSPRDLAVVVEIPEFSMNGAGEQLKHFPYSAAGAYQAASGSRVSGGATTRHSLIDTDWILGGSQSVEISLD